MMTRDRAAEAEALLHARGLQHARVSAAGHKGEIAAVRAPADYVAALTDAAPEIKALGFQYVALDLEEEPTT